MRISQDKSLLESNGLAAIEAARELETVITDSTLDLGHDATRIRRMLEAFRSGHLYRDNEEAALETLRVRVLGVLSQRVPGYRQIMLNHCTDDYWFVDEELEGIRKVWESLRMFRRFRRRVLDELAAEKQVAALRRRPATIAAE